MSNRVQRTIVLNKDVVNALFMHKCSLNGRDKLIML